MAKWDRLKGLLDRYNLTYVWDFDLNGDNKKVQGYSIRGRGYPFLHYNKEPLGLLPSHLLEKMTDTDLEEFVVGCAVLSMQPVPDVWRV